MARDGGGLGGMTWRRSPGAGIAVWPPILVAAGVVLSVPVSAAVTPSVVCTAVLFASAVVLAGPSCSLRRSASPERAWSRLARAAALPTLAAAVVVAVGGLLEVRLSPRLLLFEWVLPLALTSVTPGVTRWCERAEVRLGAVCDDDEYHELQAALAEQRPWLARPERLRLAARFVEPFEPVPPQPQARLARVGDLKSVCDEDGISLVVVGRRYLLDPAFVEIADNAAELGVEFVSFTAFFERRFRRVPLVGLDARWFYELSPRRRPLARTICRAHDVVAVGLGLLVLALTGPLVAAAILAESGRPVLFRQVRIGRGGHPFVMLKFRTMRQDAEAHGARFAAEGDPRTTRVGRVLRKTRLDELPQVINVLRGEMALIGPRPERPEFAARYAATVPHYRRRLLIAPGLTGWAQVNEGYCASDEDTVRKTERDLYYLKHRATGLDLIVLGRTVRCVLRLSGR